jgi:HTH-type transcriptional regulator / antitoxin HigA
MKPKIIKTEAEYDAALARVAELMDAAPGSQEEEDLELLAYLVEQYEKERWPIGLPDPVDAIEFRMEQAGLTRKDLERYIGSASKVSEVLNRKRPLSLNMMRALHEGLGIPAEVLLQQPGKDDLPPARYDPQDFPFAELVRRGYFSHWQGPLHRARAHGEELLEKLFAPFAGGMPEQVYCRRSASDVNTLALAAWQARAVALAEAQEAADYDPGALNERFFDRLVRLSYYDEGPRLVFDLLTKQGVHLVLLGHLPHTYLDGACFLTPAGRPAVGLTLRHDRLDNFWFTLVHELSHVKLHLRSEDEAFFDDTEHGVCPEDDPAEQAADAFTRNALIPDDVWDEEGPELREYPDERDVKALASSLEISEAIIAGRIRWETRDYTVLSSLVGSGEVRRLFPDEFHP